MYVFDKHDSQSHISLFREFLNSSILIEQIHHVAIHLPWVVCTLNTLEDHSFTTVLTAIIFCQILKTWYLTISKDLMAMLICS